MANNSGIAALVSPRDRTGVYELHLNQTPRNAMSSQTGAAQAGTGSSNCVSYDTLMAFLQERTKSPVEDRLYLPNGISISVRDTAQQAVDYLKQNPASAKLAREFLSNASCNDIAQLIEGIPAGFRDLEISQGVNELTAQAGTVIDGTYNRFHDDLIKFQSTVAYSSMILATALLIGFGSYAALRFTGRKTEK